MNDIPGNSHRGKAEKAVEPAEKIEPIVTGTVVARKRSPFKKLVENFIPGKPSDVARNVIWDVLIPGAKDMVQDSAMSFIERMFTGENRPSNRLRGSFVQNSYGQSGIQQTNYGGYSQPKQNNQRQMSREARSKHNFDELLFETRVEAENTIAFLESRIAEYRAVTVADLYEALNMKGDYTDDKWGWDNLDDARVSRHRGAYLLDLPPTKILN